jgi:hypothetical protein
MEFSPSQLVESFARICKEVVIRPRAFFQDLPQQGGLLNPLLFLMLCVFLSSLCMANILNGDYRLFLILFFSNILSNVLVSGFLHALATRAFGGCASFAATFRIIAYSSVTDLGAWIPVFGTIASLYGIYLMFLGLQELHRLKPRQAGMAVIIIMTLALAMGLTAASLGKDVLHLPDIAALFNE